MLDAVRDAPRQRGFRDSLSPAGEGRGREALPVEGWPTRPDPGIESALGTLGLRRIKIKELARTDDRDSAVTPKGPQESVARHDQRGIGCQGTLEDAVVGVVVRDRDD